MTNTFTTKHFNDFVRGELKDEITKRVIVDGQTGSSWHFKRFERLNVIVTAISQTKRSCQVEKNEFFIVFSVSAARF